MSDFTGLTSWSEPAGGILYRTTTPLIWEIGVLGSGLVVTVPSEFSFDMSVPRPLRWLVDPHNPQYRKASCLHDYLLDSGWDRIRAAAEFNLALKADGVRSGKRLALFIAVAVYKWDSDVSDCAAETVVLKHR